MFIGFMDKNAVFKCNLIIEFKDIKTLKERVSCASLPKKNVSLNAFV